ncbi:MAG: Rpn family recombination-promoting nuclease/putative transposase, partial [Fibromonadales bacterium]|nr:Rpn family recombination-promoting nuclease/putative transposase [Fibromonadales bacterium]
MFEIKTNRNHKDSVFTKLFSDKEKLLELYNAIENTSYGSDTDIQIATLENVLFMGRTNDIAFILKGKIVVLIEHQSTLNENMPMRMLIYATKIYDRLMGSKSLYRIKKIPVPKPEFIVLYNGEEDFPDELELKLSDMYIEPYGKASNTLDLTVKVLNINKGCNEELANRSETLKGYEIFVYLIREYMKTMDRDSAIECAVSDCIGRNVLKKFLEANSSEVRNMIFGEWDLNIAKKVWKEEGREELREEVLDLLK